MKGKLKGIIWSNFIYLAFFYLMFFILAPTIKLVVAELEAIPVLTPYADEIPESTEQMMDFILYVVVPLSALAFTLKASLEPEQQYYYVR